MDWYIIHQVSQVHTRLDHRASRDRPRQGAADVPEVRQRRAGGDPDHARERRPIGSGRATACCAWASGRGSTRASPKSSGDPRGPTDRRRPPPTLVAAVPDRRRLAPLGSRPELVAVRSTWRATTGGTHRWHVLDTGVPERCDAVVAPTVVCVHGNPTWGYAWARFLRRLHGSLPRGRGRPARHGLQRTHRPRRYADRVRDLDDVIVALGLPDGCAAGASRPTTGAGRSPWAGRCRTPAGRRADPVQHRHRRARGTLGAGRSSASLRRRRLLDFGVPGHADVRRGHRRGSRGRRISKIDREAFRAPYRDCASPGRDRRLRRRHPAAARASVRDRRSPRWPIGSESMHGPGAAGVG